MAAVDFHGDGLLEGAATVHDAGDTGDGEPDTLSGLPGDVLLDILGRLVEDGDVRTVARTSILSRRWRHLPWPQISTKVPLDVGDFFPHDATAGLAAALERFLAAPRSARVIQWLSLKFILTRRDHLRRIGDLVGAAAAAGVVKSVEFNLVTEVELLAAAGDKELTMLGYGDRFRQFVHDCPGAFRCLTELTVESLWWRDAAVVSDLLRRCAALEHLCLRRCGLVAGPVQAGDMAGAPMLELAVDAPRSRLKTLVCDSCHVGGVKLVHAPELVAFQHRWINEETTPVSLGHAPALRTLILQFLQYDDEDDKWRLSELLVNGDHIETILIDF
ncbi:hypothetical protein ACP4OV_001102 [Aristida adscensionis]